MNYLSDLAGNHAALEKMHKAKERPVCPCKTPNPEMYIAKFGDKYLIKRMPGSGVAHAPDCDSYEPPPELSGLGEVLGSAIKESEEEGFTELRFDFSITKMPARKPQEKTGQEEDSVRTDGSKLTLRSTLHYLWEEAGFNRWSPAMEGKRSWYTIRKHLQQAADDKLVKGKALSERLYIPETFSSERKEAIKQHWLGIVSRMGVQSNGPRQLMLMIGEIKDIVPARYGRRIVIKHAPDIHFLAGDDLYKRLEKRFSDDLMLSDLDDVHLLTISTFSVTVAGYAIIEEMALMTVTGNWIPFENIHEKALIDMLCENKRRFTKGLRYNLPRTKPLASMVLTDTSPVPTALYAIPGEVDEQYHPELSELQSNSQLATWTWDTTEFEIPDLPPATASQSRQQQEKGQGSHA